MVESTWLPINRRIFSHQELCSDSSIRSVGFWDYQNWDRIHGWYKAVNRMPLPASDRLVLKDTLLQPAYCAAYELDNPWIVIFKWPNGELKFFLITAEGNLVDPAENAIWDGAFPFLSRFEGGEIRGMAIPASVSHLPSTKWIWYPSAANFTHFFFDVFVQLVMAQEQLNKDYLGQFSLPLAADTPTWQDELLGKLLFPRPMLLGGETLSQFRFFRVKNLLLPIISHRELALDWLRGFLAKSFLASYPQNYSSGGAKLIMVTRRDARRARIQNISAIEQMVVDFGGMLVDASNLSCCEKLAVFENCSVCIGEGSGGMNSVLFAPENCRLIALTDPSVIDDKSFLIGGWPYAIGSAHRTEFIVGENGKLLPGSPVGSSSYSVERIRKLVVESL